jgi:hypothetical protein
MKQDGIKAEELYYHRTRLALYKTKTRYRESQANCTPYTANTSRKIA